MSRLRRAPYPLGTAVADVIDGFVRSHATQVHVAVEFAGVDSWIRIAGDGRGIRDADVSQDDAGGDLDRISGLAGLDVARACLSQGRALTVARREESGETSVLRAEMRQGIPHQSPVDLQRGVVPDVLLEPLVAGAGSVVLIEQLNAVLAFRRRAGRRTERHLRGLSQALAMELAQVFHRHLAGSARRPPLTITVGGTLLEPRLPFPAEGWQATPLRRRVLPFVHAAEAFDVSVIPHLVAPATEPLTAGPGPSPESRNRDGFYVYFADRLVQAGGWSSLHSPDTRDPALAIVVDIPAAAGAAFVRRPAPTMRVLFPSSLTPGLKAVVVASLHEQGPHRAA